MRIIRTTDPRPSDTLGQLALYNGFDCLSLPEILPQLTAELDDNKTATYQFEMALQAPLLEMEFNGCLVDTNERHRLTLEYGQEKRRIDGYLHELCNAVGYYDYYKALAVKQYSLATEIPVESLPQTWEQWLAIELSERKAWKKQGEEALVAFQKALKDTDEPFNSSSSDQKITLFYHFFGSPNNESAFSPQSKMGKLFAIAEPPWLKTKGIVVCKTRKPNGDYSPSTDRECLEKITEKALDTDQDHAYYWAQPFVSCCLHLADLNKTLQFLKCRLEDGLFRSTFKIGPETGRLASSKNHQNFGWNAQNVAPKNRKIFTVKNGHKLAAVDYEQIESRMVAAICYTLFGSTAYLHATESGDLHSLACSMVWDDLPWPSDFNLTWLAKHGPFPKDMVKAAKKIANEEFYRDKSRRDVSKTLGHGSNYLGKPPHMAKQSHIPFELVQHYQSVYFAVFPEIKQWHNWTIEQLMVKQELTTPIFGRTRQFFGKPSDDATVREGVAYCPQSMAADLTNSALLRLHQESRCGDLPINIFLQKHDEIGFRFKEGTEQIVLPRVKHIMEQHYTLTNPEGKTRDWHVPAEVLVGWNLGHRQDYKDGKKLATPINPDGLVEYPDKRTRKHNPFDIMQAQL